MKGNVLFGTPLLLAGLLAGAAEPKQEPAQSVTAAGSVPSAAGPADYFTGRVRVPDRYSERQERAVAREGQR